MTLTFGTAGIRGPLGDGPDHVNAPLIRQVAAAAASVIADSLPPGARGRVVGGYDARHGSPEFAREAAGVAAGAGLETLLLPRALPTPVLAYAVRHLDADAGLMITASHNPATDNGCKVYWGGRLTDEPGRGAQIIPTTDTLIQTRMASIGVVSPAAKVGWTEVGDEVEGDYVRDVAALADEWADGAGRRPQIRIALTPLHGVGGATAVAVLRAAGFEDLHVVTEQARPDPAFPTTPFPNPEIPGAVARVLSLADLVDADLALALDPDADRCGVAFPIDGRWALLTGDQIGCLLGERVAARLAVASAPAGGAPARVLASTLVSSHLLGAIAARHQLPHRTTLTGFKWLARVPRLAYAYEEALGFCVAPDLVRDKDGISAALAIATTVAALRDEGRTLADALDDLDSDYGVHRTRQVTHGPLGDGPLGSLVARLAGSAPSTLGGLAITRVADLADGFDGLPPTPGLLIDLEGGARIVVRPSGTEPRVKAYLEVVEVPSRDIARARLKAAATLDSLEEATTALPADALPEAS